MTASLSVVLYTRLDCHLCDDAMQVLQAFGIDPKVVIVDEHEILVERFGHCVPVVEINGRVRFRGRVSPVLLRRIVEAEQRRPPGLDKPL